MFKCTQCSKFLGVLSGESLCDECNDRARKVAALERSVILAEKQKKVDEEQERNFRASLVAAESQRSGSQLLLESLRPYVAQTIGVNAKDPTKVIEVVLFGVQGDHIEIEYDGMVMKIPAMQILRITLPAPGHSIKTSVFGKEYNLVIEIFHMVIYKGSVGIGVSIPS
jgi:hypothetical protein